MNYSRIGIKKNGQCQKLARYENVERKRKKKTIVEKGAKGFHQLRVVFLIITIITIIITITIIVIISFGTNNGSSRFSITSNR